MIEDGVQDLPVSSLLLDPGNYRHQPVRSQLECMIELMPNAIKRAQMLALAKDIVEFGLNPTDLIIVKPEGTKLKVQEGNRRTCSLKFLSNPQTIPDLPDVSATEMTRLRRKWAEVAASGIVPHEATCLVTSDEVRIAHWKSLKHNTLGDHHGAGTVTWDTEGRVRAEQDAGATGRATNRQTALAMSFLSELARTMPADEFDHLIARARSRGLSTLGRLIQYGDAAQRLGLVVRDTSVEVGINATAARRAYAKILEDLGTTALNSRSIHNRGDITDYLDSVKSFLPKDKDREFNEDPNPDAGEEPRASRPGRTPVARVARSPYRGLRLRCATTKTAAVLSDMQKLTYQGTPHMCVIGNRVLIELFMDDVVQDLGITQSELRTRVTKVANKVEGGNLLPRDSAFPDVRNALAAGIGDLAIGSMQGYMHRPNFVANENTARAQCEGYRSFLEAVDAFVYDLRTTATT